MRWVCRGRSFWATATEGRSPSSSACATPAWPEPWCWAAHSSGFQKRTSRPSGTLLGISEGEEVDPEKLEREQPDFVSYLREAHGHVYGPEYWKSYVKQIAALWLRPLRYTPEDIAAITDPVLLLVGDRDGVCTEESVELFRLLPNAELAVAPASDHGFIEAKAGLFDALALDFLMRHRNDSARVSK